jgi:hypothetical protein
MQGWWRGFRPVEREDYYATISSDLMHNYIGDVGARALAGLRNMTLRKFTLVLINNLIGDIGLVFPVSNPLAMVSLTFSLVIQFNFSIANFSCPVHSGLSFVR